MNCNERVAIVEAPYDVIEKGSPFGERHGDEVASLTEDHLQALKSGQTLAVDVQGEYVVFLRIKQAKQESPHG